MQLADERDEALGGLADALGQLAELVDRHGDAAAEIAGLVTRAEAIASAAWAVSCAPGDARGGAEKLARDLDEFVVATTALSERGAEAAASGHELAQAMRRHAAELGAAARELSDVTDPAMLRARLRPLARALAALPSRPLGDGAIAGDVAELGARAAGLAGTAKALSGDPRGASAAAIAVYRALHDFASAASAIAGAMTNDSAQARRAIGEMARRAQALAGRVAGEGATARGRGALPGGVVWGR